MFSYPHILRSVARKAKIEKTEDRKKKGEVRGEEEGEEEEVEAYARIVLIAGQRTTLPESFVNL